MPKFTMAVVTGAGQLRSESQVDDTAFDADAAYAPLLENLGQLMAGSPRFETTLVLPTSPDPIQVTFNNAMAPSNAFAEIVRGTTVAATGIFLSGANPLADQAALNAAQSMVTQIAARTNMKVRGDILRLTARPLLIVIPLHAEQGVDNTFLAHVPVLLAIAFFRRRAWSAIA